MSENINKEILKREVFLYGHTASDENGSACGNCESVVKKVNESKAGSTIPIEFKEYDLYKSPEGKAKVEEKKLNEMPYTEVCDVFKDNTKDCKSKLGYDEGFFTKLKEPKPLSELFK